MDKIGGTRAELLAAFMATIPMLRFCMCLGKRGTKFLRMQSVQKQKSKCFKCLWSKI